MTWVRPMCQNPSSCQQYSSGISSPVGRIMPSVGFSRWYSRSKMSGTICHTCVGWSAAPRLHPWKFCWANFL